MLSVCDFPECISERVNDDILLFSELVYAVFVNSVRYSILMLKAQPNYEFKDECLVIVNVNDVYVISSIYNCCTFYLCSARCGEYRDLFRSYITLYKNETLFVANL